MRAMFFDLDGTLIDSLPGIELSVDYALTQSKLPARQCELRPLIGPPIRRIFAQLVPDACEQQLSMLEGAFRTCYDSRGWRETVLHENAASTLRDLQRAGMRLFVVTNKPALPTAQILAALGLNDVFEDVVCPDSREPVFESKHQMLESLIEMYNFARAECRYIGDTYDDYVAALKAGIQVAIVQHDGAGLDQATRYPDGVVLRTLTELLENGDSKIQKHS